MITMPKRLKLLLAIAAAISVYVLATSAERAPATGDTAQAERGVARRPTNAAHAVHMVGDRGANPLIGVALRVSDRKAAASLFPVQSWYVAPPPPPPAPVVEVKPPPPTAPPLPFAVMGSYSRPGDATVYFLTRADRVFDVHIGDTLDNTYTVDGEANGQLLLTYKPLHIQQSLPLGGAP